MDSFLKSASFLKVSVHVYMRVCECTHAFAFWYTYLYHSASVEIRGKLLRVGCPSALWASGFSGRCFSLLPKFASFRRPLGQKDSSLWSACFQSERNWVWSSALVWKLGTVAASVAVAQRGDTYEIGRSLPLIGHPVWPTQVQWVTHYLYSPPSPKTQGSLQKREQEDGKSQWQWATTRKCFLDVTSFTHMNSLQLWQHV